MDPSGLLAQGMTAAWRLIDGYAGRTTNHLKETCRVMLHNREDSQKGFHCDNYVIMYRLVPQKAVCRQRMQSSL